VVTLDGVDDFLAFDPGVHVEKLGYFTQQEPYMRGFRPRRSHARGRFSPSATMTVLKARDVGRILVRPTDHAKEAIGPRAAANNHTFLIASNHPKLPVLSDRYTSYDRLELL
jgi:hypothetical protein